MKVYNMAKPLFDTDETVAQESVLDSSPEGAVVAEVLSRFHRAEDAKQSDESRALEAYRNFRGEYGPDTVFLESERSQVFIKVTKTKVMAAYGQIIDVLFGNNKFPLTVDPTKLPQGVAESVHMETDPKLAASPEAAMAGAEAPPPIYGTRDGPPLPPGATAFDLERAGSLKDKFKNVSDKIMEGPGTTATAVTWHPAMIAAKKMEKKIHDQLDECEASKHLRFMAFEMALFGTGIMKGPFAVDKEYPNWVQKEDGKAEYEPTIKPLPEVSGVSFWNFYPDPDAANMKESEWCIERHKMSRSQLKSLRKRPMFIKKAIDEAADIGPDYELKTWEQAMNDGAGSINVDRYEVLEYWGSMDRETIEDMDVSIPKVYKGMDELSVNIWVCNDKVIRLVFNPFKPVRLPYYAVPYELNPYSFFGIGVAENMNDTQELMNGFMRLAVDNAVLSGNLIIEVDESALVPGQDLEVYPGKTFVRTSGAPGQAIFGTSFPNVSNQVMEMFDKARELSDESTGFPSFAHGQTGVSGVGRTASGISMLMNAANGNIRTVVKNVDDYLITPLGKAMFSFNMQFDYDPSIRGDLEVNARGTESLMANEVRSQRLMQFLQVGLNPMTAPFMKLDSILREIAVSMDLDPDTVVNSLNDAALQAEILKGFAQIGQTGGGGQLSDGSTSSGSVPGLSVADTTGSGGGVAGTGTAPQPGEQGFSANKSQGQV